MLAAHDTSAPRIIDSEMGSRMMVKGSNDARSLVHLQNTNACDFTSTVATASTTKQFVIHMWKIVTGMSQWSSSNVPDLDVSADRI